MVRHVLPRLCISLLDAYWKLERLRRGGLCPVGSVIAHLCWSGLGGRGAASSHRRYEVMLLLTGHRFVAIGRRASTSCS